MSDPRVTPDPARVTGSKPMSVTRPVVDLNRNPAGARDRQLLFGDSVRVLSHDNGWSYVQSDKDSYCGFVGPDALGPHLTPTHFVCTPATHAYTAADFKSPDLVHLSFGSKVAVTDAGGKFSLTTAGYIPSHHLAPVSTHMDDPAAIANLFLGTPYLWGGNSRAGIDCSGLVQAALLACGQDCPGDSDMQMVLGSEASGPYRRNDLLFWKGHVALVTDPETLIHANAHAMAVSLEPILQATHRIAASGDGPVLAHRRL